MELFRSGNGYLETLRKRAKRSRVYSRHQLIGLLMAAYLGDRAHKALYMRLAKRPDVEQLLQAAKEVGSRANVRNKGAYFMKVITRKQVITQAQVIPQWKSSRSTARTEKGSSAKKQRSLFSLISRKKRSEN